jgi:hypothetical protein
MQIAQSAKIRLFLLKLGLEFFVIQLVQELGRKSAGVIEKKKIQWDIVAYKVIK